MADRMEFKLPEVDQDYLNNAYPNWEALFNSQSPSEHWVLIHNYELPAGYQVPTATVGLLIPAGYPRDQIDMAYFDPPLSIITQLKQPNALTLRALDGKSFQQWSRHRTKTPWRPFKDNINSHLAYVDSWLNKEAGAQ